MTILSLSPSWLIFVSPLATFLCACLYYPYATFFFKCSFHSGALFPYRPHMVTEYMGIRNESFMKIAAVGTWMGDFVTAWMVRFELIRVHIK